MSETPRPTREEMISAGILIAAKNPKDISPPTFELPDGQTSAELLGEIGADYFDAGLGVWPTA